MTTLLILFAAIFIVFMALNFFPHERRFHRRIRHEYGVEDPQFIRVMSGLFGPSLLRGNRVTALHNGDEIFPSMLEAIRSAERTICLETFIYWKGRIGREMSEALAERSRAGVRVHVLLDWIGSRRIDDGSLELMRESGIDVMRYRPLHWHQLGRLNYRTHRKLLIVDGKIGFTGGAGIADFWLGDARNESEWRDAQFRVEGPVVAEMQAAFMDNWIVTREEVLHDESYFPPLEPAGDEPAQMFISSPEEGSESVRLMYMLSVAAARRSILISTAYFVPDQVSIRTMIEAVRRGVRVRIIIPGRKIDTKVVRRASRSRWGPLLAAGVEIWEYQPTMYHYKAMVVDELWVSVGSTNFDNRSFKLNDEANLNVLSQGLAKRLTEAFEKDLSRSKRVTYESWKHRPLSMKIVDWTIGIIRKQL
jgi:cardiolipin synthase A/B